MPVAIVAGQTRGIEADHEPGIAKADLGDQLLEAVTLDAARARFAKILVDDLHTLVRPSQSRRRDRPGDIAAPCSPDAGEPGSADDCRT